MDSTKISLVLFLCLFGLYSETVKSSKCGTDETYCGAGTPSSGGLVSKMVTQDFFNSIINQAGNGCEGKTFYTRNSFIDAANTFPNFANSVTKREIATMFAHFTHETGHFCYIKGRKQESHDGGRYCNHPAEQNSCEKPPPGRGYCRYPEDFPGLCTPPAPPRQGKGYFRRGQSLSLDLLSQSELVASNPTVTFRTGLRVWMNIVRPVLKQGFGATIRAINGMECDGGNSDAINARIGYYRAYCGQLGVDPGPNLSC